MKPGPEISLALAKRSLSNALRRVLSGAPKPKRRFKPKTLPPVNVRKLTENARRLLILRASAVLFSIAAEADQGGARAKTARTFEIAFGDEFPISVRSLERWESLFQEHGFDGLIDRKQGRCGRPKKERSSSADSQRVNLQSKRKS